MTHHNDADQDTARETPTSKGTVAVDTSAGDSPRTGRGFAVRPAAGTPPVGLPRAVEPSLAPGVRKAVPRSSFVGRLLSYLRVSSGD